MTGCTKAKDANSALAVNPTMRVRKTSTSTLPTSCLFGDPDATQAVAVGARMSWRSKFGWPGPRRAAIQVRGAMTPDPSALHAMTEPAAHRLVGGQHRAPVRGSASLKEWGRVNGVSPGVRGMAPWSPGGSCAKTRAVPEPGARLAGGDPGRGLALTPARNGAR